MPVRQGQIANRVVLLMFMAFSGRVAIAQLNYEAKCHGPTDLTTIEVSKNSRTYSYTVVNSYKSSLGALAFGGGEREEMQITSENRPKRIASPNGWSGKASFKEGTIYMNVWWFSVSSGFYIGQGKTLSGFRVEMPEEHRLKEPLYFPDGTRVHSLDMAKAPFRAYFADGTCAWGRVSEHRQ